MIISNRFASAASTCIDLVWVVRREQEPYQRIENDPLPQRDRLYAQGNSFYSKAPCEEGGLRVTYLKGCLVQEFREVLCFFLVQDKPFARRYAFAWLCVGKYMVLSSYKSVFVCAASKRVSVRAGTKHSSVCLS